MESRSLKKFVHFNDAAVQRETVFETERLWTEVLCFSGNQSMGPVVDEDADAMFTVLAGEGAFVVDGKRKRLEQWAMVLVPAGSEGSVTNASAEPLVLMLVASPPPVARAVSG